MFSLGASFTRSILPAKYSIHPQDVAEVICHRRTREGEEYLVRWRTKSDPLCPPRALASWHTLPELCKALYHVQEYIEKGGLSGKAIDTFRRSPALASGSRKRKSPDDDSPVSHALLDPSNSTSGAGNGLLTPEDSSMRSRSPSVSKSEPEYADSNSPKIYNGILQKKEGRLVAKSVADPEHEINASTLPTAEMRVAAAKTPVIEAERAIRAAFDAKLRKVRKVRLENDHDSTTPSLNFTFIKDYQLGKDVTGNPAHEFAGCTKYCRPDMGQNIGCEYTAKCECLEFAAVDEKALAKKYPEEYQIYLIAKADGEGVDTAGFPKRFPYTKPSVTGGPQTLVPFYREERHPIYECNENCRCLSGCKSRLVQKGRKVPLVIFKTPNRGWGVKCDEDLIAGEFIDTYLGEVITDEECSRREDASSKAKASYLYSLDKFVGDYLPDGESILEKEDCYVVDGQHMGNVTRFINHSCEPNIRQYTVSYNKHDTKLYNLAFFAYEDISAGTELTFDYMDHDEQELEDVIRAREAGAQDPQNIDKIQCHCGAAKCRWYLWV